MTEETKHIRQFTRTVYSTEDLLGLQRAVKQAGGRIIRTIALRDGAGISCTIEIDSDARQF